MCAAVASPWRPAGRSRLPTVRRRGLLALASLGLVLLAPRRGEVCWASPADPSAPLPRGGEPSPRRQLLTASAAAATLGSALARPPAALAEAAPAAELTELQKRLNETDLSKLPSGFIPGWGPDDLYYPSWIEGRWRVTQTLLGYSVPQGKQFLANGNADVANKVLQDQQNQLGKPVEFELRYLRTQRNNTVEDRAFNLGSRTDAFAGKKVVRGVEYTDVPDNTRAGSLKSGNGPDDPLLTTLISFKGAVEKVFITAFQTEQDEEKQIWRGLASQRTLFAAPGAGYNPLAVDEETVQALRKGPQGVKGRLRLVGFLNPNDPLFFKAGNKAVSIADYSLQYTYIGPIEPKPAIPEEAAASAAAS